MNFFKLYIGDYLRDTGTLTVAEHGAYMLMLVNHYATEKPLPVGKELYRLLRAESRQDRDAVDLVVRRFWVEVDGGLSNPRAGVEFSRAEHQREVNRSVGKLGGRPKRTKTESVSESEPNHNPNQTPDTRQEISEANASSSAGLTDSAATPIPKPAIPPCPHETLIELFHEVLPELPRVRLKTADRQKALAKLWRWVQTSRRPDGLRRAEDSASGVEWFRLYFGQVRDNDFLMGRTPRSGPHAKWACTLDYLLTDRGMKQVIERTYDNEAAA